MRRMVVAGNWKMNKLTGEARQLASELKSRLSDVKSRVTVILCPPLTALAEVADSIAGTDMALGAQNVYWEEKGAYTGEVSALMLKDAGCAYAIIGHSERRQHFGETDETVNRKIKAVLGVSLKPIVCVGESERQREEEKTEAVIVDQIRNGLVDLTAEEMANMIIAYEPIWAIGTGKNATPQQAQDVHALIRELVSDAFGEAAASSLPILYGGSVKPGNAGELLAQADIDGALVGGASLEAESFEAIVRAGAAVVVK